MKKLVYIISIFFLANGSFTQNAYALFNASKDKEVHSVKNQAESTVKVLITKIEVLKKRIKASIKRNPTSEVLLAAKDDLQLFESYFWNESIPWFERQIENLYLSGNYRNSKFQWKKKDIILKYEENCLRHLEKIEKSLNLKKQ